MKHYCNRRRLGLQCVLWAGSQGEREACVDTLVWIQASFVGLPRGQSTGSHTQRGLPTWFNALMLPS